MNPERKMRRAREKDVSRDLKLLNKYSMNDKEALSEMKRLYHETPLADRPAAMLEIERHARACAFHVNLARYQQGKQN
jgi:hypothetical protein